MPPSHRLRPRVMMELTELTRIPDQKSTDKIPCINITDLTFLTLKWGAAAPLIAPTPSDYVPAIRY